MFDSILCCVSIGATGNVVRLFSLAGLIHKHAYGCFILIESKEKSGGSNKKRHKTTQVYQTHQSSLYINLKPQGRKIIIIIKKNKKTFFNLLISAKRKKQII